MISPSSTTSTLILLNKSMIFSPDLALTSLKIAAYSRPFSFPSFLETFLLSSLSILLPTSAIFASSPRLSLSILNHSSQLLKLSLARGVRFGGLTGHIVDNDRHGHVCEVGGDDAPELLLACGVPEGKSVGFVPVVDIFGQEIESHGWLRLSDMHTFVDLSKVSYMNLWSIEVLPTDWSPRKTIFIFFVPFSIPK